jgi:hypothetical protein
MFGIEEAIVVISQYAGYLVAIGVILLLALLAMEFLLSRMLQGMIDSNYRMVTMERVMMEKVL